MSNDQGILVVISGPSGVGKGTVVDVLIKRLPQAVLEEIRPEWLVKYEKLTAKK